MVRWLRLPIWLPCVLLAWLPAALQAATPSRVVSVVPHLTELLYEIGAGDKLVAIDDASDYPAEVKTKPKVANYRSINVEALLAQKPDLILGWRSAQSRMLAPLEQLGIPVFYSEPTDFASPGDRDAGAGQIAWSGEECQRSRRSLSGAPAFPATALWPTNRCQGVLPALVPTAHQRQWQCLARSGHRTLRPGINIMANAKTPYPQVDMEQVIRVNPSLILAGSQDPDALRHWRKWPNLDAVQHQRLDLINSDELHRFTPRALNAVEQVCQAITQPNSK